MLRPEITQFLFQTAADALAVFDSSEKMLGSNACFTAWFAHENAKPFVLSAIFADGAATTELQIRDDKGKRLSVNGEKIETTIEGVSYTLFRARNMTELHKQKSLLESVSRVAEINRRLVANSAKNLSSILNSLPQAFILFDKSLRILPDFSKRAVDMIGEASNRDLLGANLIEILNLKANLADVFALYFKGTDFEVLEELFPKEISRDDRILQLKFLPILEEESTQKLMLILEDVTQVRKLAARIEEQNRKAQSVYRILEFKLDFLDLLVTLEDLSKNLGDVSTIKRLTHTLKGGFGFLECIKLADVCHTYEMEWRAGHYCSESGARLAAELTAGVDELLRDVKGVVSFDTGPSTLSIKLTEVRKLYGVLANANVPAHILSRISDLASVPAGESLKYLDRVWEQALNKSGKRAHRIHWSGEAYVHRDPFKGLFKSLMHIVRNAADHGIETPEVRQSKGKDARGNLWIALTDHDDTLTIEFRDDGGGLDESAVLQSSAPGGTNATSIIFDSGVSSRSEVTSLSGLGVGLAAVKEEVDRLGGSIKVTTTPGTGMSIAITVKKVNQLTN